MKEGIATVTPGLVKEVSGNDTSSVKSKPPSGEAHCAPLHVAGARLPAGAYAAHESGGQEFTGIGEGGGAATGPHAAPNAMATGAKAKSRRRITHPLGTRAFNRSLH